MRNMENLRIGTKVILSSVAKTDTYPDMDWKEDILKITHKEQDNQECGYLYSFKSVSSDKEITCSLYGYELELYK